MGPLMYFDNGNEDVASFPIETLTMIEGGNDIVNLYFGNAQQHIVVLACADGASDVVARALSVAISLRKDSRKIKMLTIADDTLSTYLVTGIVGVTSITADPA